MSTDAVVCVVSGVVVPFVLTFTVVKLWRGEALPWPVVVLGLLCLFAGGRRR